METYLAKITLGRTNKATSTQWWSDPYRLLAGMNAYQYTILIAVRLVRMVYQYKIHQYTMMIQRWSRIRGRCSGEEEQGRRKWKRKKQEDKAEEEEEEEGRWGSDGGRRRRRSDGGRRKKKRKWRTRKKKEEEEVMEEEVYWEVDNGEWQWWWCQMSGTNNNNDRVSSMPPMRRGLVFVSPNRTFTVLCLFFVFYCIGPDHLKQGWSAN